MELLHSLTSGFKSLLTTSDRNSANGL
jgi:hypothetical protein